MMQFRNLPAKFHIGAMRIDPRSPLCYDLKPCIACNCVSTEFLKCVQAHVTCNDCVHLKISSCSNESDQQLHIWCEGCNKRVPAIRAVLSDWFLQMLEFACHCGYSGTLDRIKKHLDSTRCKCLASVAKTHARRESLSAKVIQDLKDFDEKLKRVKEKAAEIESKVAEFSESQRAHNGVIEAAQLIPSKLAALFGSRGMIFFNFYSSNERTWAIEKPKNQRYYFSGVPLIVCPDIEEIEQKQWLNISIGPGPRKRNKPHHYKMKIKLKVHDARGGVVRQLEKATFRDGRYIHSCFEYPDGSMYRITRVFDLVKLSKEGILIGDQLCLSLELEFLEEQK